MDVPSGLSATVACRSASALLHGALLRSALSALGSHSRGAAAEQRGTPAATAVRMLVHGASAALASLIACPLEVALVRMQGDEVLPPAQRRGYRSVQDALWRIGSQEGLGVLWSGVLATAIRATLQSLAASAGCVCGALEVGEEGPRGLRLLLRWLLPLGCRVFGLLFWLPIDAVKSRQQHQLSVLSARKSATAGESIERALHEIIVFSDGPAALFRGLGASIAHGEAVAAMQALLDGATAGGTRDEARDDAAVPDEAESEAGACGPDTSSRCGHLSICPPAR